MARKRVSVRELAVEAGLDTDEALVALWDTGFDDVLGPGHLLSRGESNRARRALGLATRRELASADYWAELLSMPVDDLIALLGTLGVPRPFEGGSLTKKAIHRLAAEERRRGTPPVAAPALVPIVEAPAAEVAKPDWRPIGHERPMVQITASDIRGIHDALVEDFASASDPIDPPGLRSAALLDSAAGRPSTSLGNNAKYPTIEMAAASLLHAIVHNHPFFNGNKRTALVAMLVFLDENSLVLTCDEDELFKLVLQLAQHTLVTGARHHLPDLEVLHISRWLKDRTRWVERGDRAIPWRRLRRILTSFDCVFEMPGTGGSRVNISRIVQRPPARFRKPKTDILRSQVSYGDEGREVDKKTVNKIRHDLELDDDHGIDSGSFYDNVPQSPSEFIIKYRKILRRLARL